MKTPTHLLLLALSLGGLSCSGSVPVDHEEHDFEDGEDVDLGTQPWRERRRMDVDQLEASLREVTGGIGWERMNGDGTVRTRYFREYADTLGMPDYINSSAEDLSVSLLFQKFLDDAARSACLAVLKGTREPTLAREAFAAAAREAATRRWRRRRHALRSCNNRHRRRRDLRPGRG